MGGLQFGGQNKKGGRAMKKKLEEFDWCCEDLEDSFMGLKNHRGINFCPFCGTSVSEDCREHMFKIALSAEE